MLPQSVRRQHQTDENYIATRQKILDSKTIKKLFDNLNELKHWSYMTPDSNDKSTGAVTFMMSKQLSETQTTACIDSSHINCDNRSINEPCTLSPGLTWRTLEEMKRQSSNIAKTRMSGLTSHTY